MARSGDLTGEPALILALARGDSQRDAARASRVGLRTVTRRLAAPAFVAAVQEERARLLERAGGRLADSAASFADVLLAVAQDSGAPASARVSAARAGLELSVRMREADVLRQSGSHFGAADSWDALVEIRREVAELSPGQVESELRMWAADIGLVQDPAGAGGAEIVVGDSR